MTLAVLVLVAVVFLVVFWAVVISMAAEKSFSLRPIASAISLTSFVFIYCSTLYYNLPPPADNTSKIPEAITVEDQDIHPS